MVSIAERVESENFLRIPPWSWNQLWVDILDNLIIAIGCILCDTIPFHSPVEIIICQRNLELD